MLFEPDRHEALAAAPWSESAAHAAMARIVASACRDFTPDGLWPTHPDDRREASEPLRMLYCGAAGVMWALEHLHRAGESERPPDFSAARAGLLEANRRLLRRFTPHTGSLLMGDAGILLLEWTQSRSERVAAELAQCIAENQEHPSLEQMLGAPGTMLAALAMHGFTREERWADLFRSSAAALWRTLAPDADLGAALWTQDFLGERAKLIGAVHGFAGNVLPILRGRELLPEADWKRWQQSITQTISKTALREDAVANWPQSHGKPRPGRTALLVQHCHGAPGVVNCLAGLPPDPELDRLLVEAGELTWRAGPLRKGANLCHGTAGNGYALLKLFRRTRDPVWLERARAFAMHAIGQSERSVRESGRAHHSLWTGDVGCAVYLWSCLRADDRFPTLELF